MEGNTLFSNTASQAETGKTAHVNGIDIYYETYGVPIVSAGEQTPLVVLHGGMGGIGMFAYLLPSLSQGRPIIGAELQAHAHTADVDRPMSFETMADDIAALIDHLKIPQADLLGYSLGGGVALQTAIRHAERVRRLVLISTPFKRQGWYPEVLAGMAAMTEDAARGWVGSPMHQAYMKVAPKPEDWTVLVDKIGRLLEKEYDWSAGVAALRLPVMIIAGDSDSVIPAHAVEFFRLLGGGQRDAGLDGSGMISSRLAILPATSHYTILYSPFLAPAVTQFLDASFPPR